MSFLRNVWYSKFWKWRVFLFSLFGLFHDFFDCPFADLAENIFAPKHFTSPTRKQATSHSSPHDTTLPLLIQPNPTYSSPHPNLAASTPQSHPPHSVKGTFVQLCSPNIPLRVPDVVYAEAVYGVWIPNLVALPIIGLPHAQSFSVCLSSWIYVVCKCVLLYLSVYLCFARCMFSVLLHIHFTFFNFKKHIYMNFVVHITLFIWLCLFHQHL